MRSILFFTILFLFLITLSSCCCTSNSYPTYTQEQLNKITVGMTLNDVEKITGFSGEIIKETNMGPDDEVDFKNFKRVAWKNSYGSGIFVTFHDNKVFESNWWKSSDN